MPVVAVAVDVGAAAVLAGALRVVAPATPFLMVPMTVRLGAAAAAALAGAAVAPTLFLTTVEVLPSLDSLTPLTLRAVREGAAARAAAAAVVAVAPRRVLGAAEAELAVEDAVALRVAAAALVDRAFSTMLLIRVPPDGFFTGDGGRDTWGFAGDAGAVDAVVTMPLLRGAILVLEDVGDRTCDGLCMTSGAGDARMRFLGLLMSMFSLLPPAISSLVRFGGLPGPRDTGADNVEV